MSSCDGLNIVDCTTSDVHSAVAANCGVDGTINGQTNVNEVKTFLHAEHVYIVLFANVKGSVSPSILF